MGGEGGERLSCSCNLSLFRLDASVVPAAPRRRKPCRRLRLRSSRSLRQKRSVGQRLLFLLRLEPVAQAGALKSQPPELLVEAPLNAARSGSLWRRSSKPRCVDAHVVKLELDLDVRCHRA